MGLIEKNDLQLDYNWSTTPGETPIDRDEIGGVSFDSQNGQDVLSLLNDYAEKNDLDRKEDVLEAEDLIRNDLPKDLNTDEDVMDWLWSKLGNMQKTV
ncbi:hypothetical protein [Gracilimonas sp.]|uniref:hypothetical protein n=1 Tax=Gracilimonas sp. TaxID=1974203 RepID=UPI00287129FF|nr:hypothetical protein [Gracilimonas sp.]